MTEIPALLSWLKCRLLQLVLRVGEQRDYPALVER